MRPGSTGSIASANGTSSGWPRRPSSDGDRVEFVAISPEELVREGAEGDLTPLVASVERDVPRPYRAEGIRRERDLWAVAARRIQVVRLRGIDGEEIELASHGGERTLTSTASSQFGVDPHSRA